MLLELFSFVEFNNAIAFVYAYIQCLERPVNWFSLTFCILMQVFLLLTVTLRGVSNKHCLLSGFHFYIVSLGRIYFPLYSK